MEIYFSGKSSIDVVTANDNEKCFLTANTTEYNVDGNCGVSVGDIEAMKEFGWSDKEDIAALETLKIGERYNSEEYGSTAFVIRLA